MGTGVVDSDPGATRPAPTEERGGPAGDRNGIGSWIPTAEFFHREDSVREGRGHRRDPGAPGRLTAGGAGVSTTGVIPSPRGGPHRTHRPAGTGVVVRIPGGRSAPRVAARGDDRLDGSVAADGLSATCTVTINSSTPGVFLANATATVGYPGLATPITRTTDGKETTPGSGVLDSGPATKKYVDAKVAITPNAANEVGNAHTFTVTVTALPDATGLKPNSWSITPSVAPTPGLQNTNTCAAPTVAADGLSATCTMTINSATAGTFTANATATVGYPGLPAAQAIVRKTGDGLSGDSGAATKAFADANIAIAPSAANEVGHAHTFTVTVKADNGGGGLKPVAGVKPTVSLSPVPGTVTDGCATTGTDANGQCTVTINSSVAGTFVANASATLTVATSQGNVTLTRDTDPATPATSGPGGSGPATKVYVAGFLVWQKVDASTGALLGGAEFSVCGPNSATTCVTVVDNTGQAGYVGYDRDPAAGKFKVVSVTSTSATDPSLPVGTPASPTSASYVITETKAPTGYDFPTVKTATVNLSLTKLDNTADNLVFRDPPGSRSQIAPTTTTCQQFRDGTAGVENTLSYGVQSGKINSVSPGVIFYYAKVIVPAGAPPPSTSPRRGAAPSSRSSASRAPRSSTATATPSRAGRSTPPAPRT